MKARFLPLVAWIGAALPRHRAPRQGLAAVGLCDHLRRDVGLPPRDPLARAFERSRYGLPL